MNDSRSKDAKSQQKVLDDFAQKVMKDYVAMYQEKFPAKDVPSALTPTNPPKPKSPPK